MLEIIINIEKESHSQTANGLCKIANGLYIMYEYQYQEIVKNCEFHTRKCTFYPKMDISIFKKTPIILPYS